MTIATRLVTAVADATGTAVFSMPDSPQPGWIWTGNLSCTNCPPGANFTAAIQNVQWGQWVGTMPWGPMSTMAGQTLVVTGTGLTPTVSYQLQYLFEQTPEESSSISIPQSLPASQAQIESVVTLIDQTFTATVAGGQVGSGATINFQIPTNIRRVSIGLYATTITSTNVRIAVVGTKTHIAYYNIVFAATAPPVKDLAWVEPLFEVPNGFHLLIDEMNTGDTGHVVVVGSVTSPLEQIQSNPASSVNVSVLGTTQPLSIVDEIIAVSPGNAGFFGLYYGAQAFNISTAADTFPAGEFFIVNPLASGTTVSIREIGWDFGTSAADVDTPTTARHAWTKFIFTGGSVSGGTITPLKRATTDSAAAAVITTSITGLTGTAIRADAQFIETPSIMGASPSGSFGSSPQFNRYSAEERLQLAPGEGMHLRQATAGTASDPRAMSFYVIWDEH